MTSSDVTKIASVAQRDCEYTTREVRERSGILIFLILLKRLKFPDKPVVPHLDICVNGEILLLC